MKRLKEVEIDVCDTCGAEHAWTTCESCCKVVCDSCGKLEFTEYWNGVYGGCKIRFCSDCVVKFTKSKENELFNALLVVQTLRRIRMQRADWAFNCAEAALEFLKLKLAGEDHEAALAHFLELKGRYDAWKLSVGIEIYMPGLRVPIPENVMEQIRVAALTNSASMVK